MSLTKVSYSMVQGAPINVQDYGAVGDGTTDDTAAIQAAISAAEGVGGKLVFPQANYRISAALTVTLPITIDGQMAQIYQQTTNTSVFIFDEGASGASNYQYAFNVQNLVVATAAGLGNAFVFRNINESTFRNLYVVGTGDIAFYFQGCLLNLVEHCYTGDGLTASPGFFVGSLPTNRAGFVIEAYNGLGSNTNVFNRCTATNSTVYAFIVDSTGNTFINCDAEGINSGADHFLCAGESTSIIGGNFEGTGGGIIVSASGCSISNVNCLTFCTINAGVTGTTIKSGSIKYLEFLAGANNNSVDGVSIIVTGYLTDNGTDNSIINVENSSGTQLGMFQSGTFTPLLKFGGASAASAYFSQIGSWWRNGNIVNFTCFIQIQTLTAATGDATIDLNDIGYASVGTINIPCAWFGNGVPVGAGYGNIIPLLDAGTKNVLLYKVLDTTGINASLTNADFSSSDQLTISGFYPLTRN